MKQILVSSIFVCSFATIGFTAEVGRPTPTIVKYAEPDRAVLYDHHQKCSRAAKKRPLSRGEVDLCQTVYLHLKLSFLDDVSPDTYPDLSAADRARVNREGYSAFRNWLQDVS